VGSFQKLRSPGRFKPDGQAGQSDQISHWWNPLGYTMETTAEEGCQGQDIGAVMVNHQ